jgi:conjugative relaxase-like TrwC/TraI family protein
MLNIGKLVRDQADYYLNAVARSQEEYYTGAGEAPGYWLGSAAEELGLAGEVSDEELHRMLNGAHPLTAERLGSPPRDHRVAGFDLAFRAPKSVSLLYGLGSLDTTRHVRAAHEHAIGEALRYLERHAALVARGHARAQQERASGFVAAAYQHRTSRAGDPLLHTHVLVANLGRGSDERWTALYGRALYRHAKTAGYLYQAVLRAELTRRIGVAWGPVRNGVADVRGVPRPVIEEFSQRRQQIRERLAELGQHTARSAQAAALETRSAKEAGISQATLRGSWHRRAAALGVTQQTMDALLEQAVAKPPTVAKIQAAIEQLASAQGLTLHTSTFTRRDVLQCLCDQLPAGAEMTVNDLEWFADRFLESRLVRAVTTDARPGSKGLVGQARQSAYAAVTGEWRFTTQELLDVEAAAVVAAARRQGEGVGMVPPPVVEQVLTAHTRPDAATGDAGARDRLVLSDEQASMVHALTTSPDGVQVVNAKAGSGKTSVLRAAHQAWEAAGYRVVGAALAARAAQELHRGSGIAAQTIARLLGDLDKPSSSGMVKDLVLVIDEAGMVGTRQLARLLAHAQHAGAKVVLVGDVAQLPEIEAGGLFRSLVQRLGAVQLQTNQRQREPWEQQALDLLRSGDAVAAIARYVQHDRVVMRSRAGRLRRRMVEDWWAATKQPGERPPIMIALRHSDVAELNATARTLLAEQGRIGGDPIRIGQRDFAVGDRIITLRNARRLGVFNGTFATVIGVDHQGRALLVRTDDGRDLVLPRWYLDRPGPFDHRRRIDHAYAITCHKAQGMTTDRAFMLATDDIYKEWGYVAMSRGRLENRLYLAINDPNRLTEDLDMPPEPTTDAMLDLTAALEQPKGQYLAHDQLATTGSAASRPALFRSDADDNLLLTAQGSPHARSLSGEMQQELASLIALRRATAIDVLHAREQMAAQRLGWRQRRLLSKTIASGGETLADLDRRIAGLKTPARETRLSEHRQTTSQVADQRTLERHPPRYLLAELGGWPRTQAAQTVWRIAARQISAYRASAGVDDLRATLGPQPDHPDQRSAYDAVARLVQDAAAAIDALEGPAPPDPDDDVSLPGPL